MTRRSPPTPPATPANPPAMPATDLRERTLADFAALKIPVSGAQLDAMLAQPVRAGLSHQQFLHLLVAEQADQKRERGIARRIREARCRARASGRPARPPAGAGTADATAPRGRAGPASRRAARRSPGSSGPRSRPGSAHAGPLPASPVGWPASLGALGGCGVS